MARNNKTPAQVKAEAKKIMAHGENDPVTHLMIRSTSDGFRRAGRAWSKEAVTVSVDEFTEEQIEQLLGEPMLVVTPVAASTGAAEAKDGGDAK